jgi:hypothetical protein
MEKKQRRSYHNYNHYDDDYDSAEERFSPSFGRGSLEAAGGFEH